MLDSTGLDRCLQTLGLRGPVDRRELQQAYKVLAQRLHPDHARGNPHATEAFQRVTEAYSRLKDLTEHRERGGAVGVCSRCERLDRLCTPARNGALCATCVLARPRLLPGPLLRAIRGWLVMTLQVAALAVGVQAVRQSDLTWAAAALLTAGGSFIALWAACRSAIMIER